MAKKFLTSPPEQKTMPSGIKYIVGNEAAERFSFYGMKTILMVFITGHLVKASGAPDIVSNEVAKEWTHNFVMAAYFLPLLGAIVSDWFLGKYRTILWLSMLYCVGHGILAMMDLHTGIDQRHLLIAGLACIALGSGGIKPCVSAHVGDQFGRMNQYLLPVVFAWFYFSINFGSSISTYVTPELAKISYSLAFGVPAIVMALATFVFWLGRNEFVHVPPAGPGFLKEVFGPEGRRAMLNLIPLFLLVAPFWSVFDQTTTSWVSQALVMDRKILGWRFDASQLQAVNPVFVLMLIPVFNYLVYPTLGRFFKVTPFRKIGIGFLAVLPAWLIPTLVEYQLKYDKTTYGQTQPTEEMEQDEEAIRRWIREQDPSNTVTRIEIDRSTSPMDIQIFSVAPDEVTASQSDLVKFLDQGNAALHPYLSSKGDQIPEDRKSKEQKSLEAREFNVHLELNRTDAPSIGWQILAYFFLTAAEVLISITCLEFSYTQSPKEMKSYIMSLYLMLSVGAGNFFTSQVNHFIESSKQSGSKVLQGADYYWFFFYVLCAMPVIFPIWTQFYRGKTYLQSDDETGVASDEDQEVVPPRQV